MVVQVESVGHGQNHAHSLVQFQSQIHTLFKCKLRKMAQKLLLQQHFPTEFFQIKNEAA